MNITGSNDITLLRIGVYWDISSTTPQIILSNLSQGDNLGGCSWWFIAKSPSNTIIHEGSESNPDIVGNWTDDTLSDAWPRPFNNIEYSGAPYQFQAYVKDSDGNIYAGDIQLASICRPPGNTSLSKNAFGLATADVQVKCSEGYIFFQDTTNHTYKGLEGTLGSSVLRVIYPVDETGNIPDPFVADHFSTALVPITYSSDNYQYQSSSIYEYDLGGYSYVRIKYQSFNPVNGTPAVRIPVLCNIDLCPLFCEVDKLVNSIETGSCSNAVEANEKLSQINPLLWMISMGIQQPLCGVDVPALIERVKAIGGFSCNCCNAPTGIIPTRSSVIDGYNFEVITECGDISGTVEKNGNNIQILLSDKKYIFEMCDSSPSETTAFEVRQSVDGCTKTYCLFVDITQLATDILNTIAGSAELVALFNSIVQSQAGNFDLIVDGGCIFQSTSTCDYTFTLSNIPSSGSFALLSKVATGTVQFVPNYPFNLTNLSGLQSYLNSIGIGTFVVTNPSAQTVLITSTANPNDLVGISYKISGITYSADITKACTGYVAKSANEVVQAIINYLCNLDDSQIVTSASYEICYVDENGDKQTETIAAGVSLVSFITSLLTRGCTTIDYIVSLGGVNCENVIALFANTASTLQANDYFLANKSGACTRVYPLEAFLQMLTLGAYDANVLTAFCNMVALCAAGATCEPYTYFYLETESSP